MKGNSLGSALSLQQNFCKVWVMLLASIFQENQEEARVWGSNDCVNDAIFRAGGRKWEENDRRKNR